MIDTRTRLIAIAGSLALLLLILDLVRRRRLKEEYSALWISAALVLLLLAAWVELLQKVTDLIGGVALSTTLFLFALLFVLFMLLHFSTRVSTLERRLTALVQELALRTDSSPAPPVLRRMASPEPASPRVAVLVPCFNDGPLAVEAVGSVKEDEPVEIVVVDDGSDAPETLKALADLEDRGVRVVRQENTGLGGARMAGLAATSAPLVYPLDADDLLEPGALKLLADALDADPDAGFAWGDYTLFGAQTGYYRSPDRWLPWTLTYVNPYPVCSLFRRAALEQAGGWHGWAYEDWDLWLRFVGLGIRGVRVSAPVYQRRVHDQSRLLTQARMSHQKLFDELQARNPAVFAERRAWRHAERPAVWKRLGYPVLFGPRKYVPLRVELLLQRTMMRLGTGLPG